VSWRDAARPLIAETLAATRGAPEKEIRKALRDAYPWGPREHHPYKIWCDEVRRQRGLKPALGARTVGSDPRQETLFASASAAKEIP
jgi:hypothetical protein